MDKAKATITPSPTPVVWLPQAPAVGGELEPAVGGEGGGSGVAKFEVATLGQCLFA